MNLERPEIAQWAHSEKPLLHQENGKCKCKSQEQMYACPGYTISFEVVMPEICGNLDRNGCEKCLYAE